MEKKKSIIRFLHNQNGIAFRAKTLDALEDMGDRSYMRRSESEYSNNLEVVKWLIIVNIAVFVLQGILRVWFGNLFIGKYFSLSPAALSAGYVWTIITYGFLHASFIHILVNMLAIFFIGRILEPVIGSSNLLKVYFASILLGGVTWLLFGSGHGGVLVGASAGAFGLMTFFCLMYPETLMTVLLFFVIPVTMKPKWILWGMIAIEGFLFLVYELPGRSFVASSGHLGGILAGTIMYQLIIKHRLFSFKKINVETPKWVRKITSPKISNPKFKVNITDKETLKKEVDRILDKINHKGFSSLSDEEKKTLDKAKDVLESQS